MKKQPCRLLRTESLNTGKPKNKPYLKKLNSEWIQAQQTGENRTSKQRAWWKTAQQKTKTKTQNEKVTHGREKGALRRTKENKKKEEETTRREISHKKSEIGGERH